MAKEKRTSVHFDRDKNAFVGITKELKKQLSDTFPGVDIDQEISKMHIWLITNPAGRSRIGSINFIMHWLGRSFENKGIQVVSKEKVESDSPLGILYQEYLNDLWKNATHIHEFNTIRR